MTQQEITQDLIRVNRLGSYRAQISNFLWPYFAPKKDGEADFQNKVLDFSANTGVGEALGNSDIKGLEYFTECEYLNLIGNNNLNRGANISTLIKLKYFRTSNNLTGSISQVMADVSEWEQLEEIYWYRGWGVYGDFSHFTTLKKVTYFWFLRAQDQPPQFVPPIIANNHNLRDLFIQADAIPLELSTIGDISVNMALKTLQLINFASTTATVNEILSRARALKQAGGQLVTLNLSGANMGIPTGGNSNTDKVALQGLGVTVTVRTS